MSVYEYLELQPIDPQDDGSISELDDFKHDDTISLTNDPDGEELQAAWTHILEEYHTGAEEESSTQTENQ